MTTITKRKKPALNYLSNLELLHEIDVSKNSYSSFIDPKYKVWSVIVNDLSEVTPELIEEAKGALETKRFNLERRKLILEGNTKKEAEAIARSILPSPDEYTNDDIVIRCYTTEHIPEEVLEPRKTFLNRIHFPAFKNYIMNEDGTFKEVGRSHWKGDFETGHFSHEHGKISRKLAESLILLTHRYGTKANFSGYSYLDEMKSTALVQLSLVALQFDESKSDNPFAWYTTTCYNSFIKILKAEKRERNIKDEIMQNSLGMSSHNFQIENETSE